MENVRAWTPYDALIYALLTDPVNLAPVARRLLGQAAYGKINIFKAAAPGAADVIATLFTNRDVFSSFDLGGKTTPAGRGYLEALSERVPNDFGQQISPDVLEKLVLAAKEYYIAVDAFTRCARDVKAIISGGGQIKAGDVQARVAQWRNESRNVLQSQAGLKHAGQLAEESRLMFQSMARGETAKYVVPFLLDHDQINPLDNKLAGMPRGEITAIVSDSGKGKTALAQRIGINNAIAIKRTGRAGSVLILSMELKAMLWVARQASVESEVNQLDGRRGGWTEDHPDYLAITAALDEFYELPLAASDKPGLNAEQIRDLMDQMVDIYGAIDLVIYDFARLGRSVEKTESETTRVEAIFYEFRDLMKDYYNPDGTNPAGLIITELKKDLEPPYSQGDMKYGGIAASAVIIFLIDQFYFRDHKPLMNAADFIPEEVSQYDRLIQVEKNRNGYTGFIKGVQYVGDYTKWKTSPLWENSHRGGMPHQRVNLEGF